MILTSPSYLSSKIECCNVDYNLENLSRYHFLMHSIPFVYVLSLVDMTHSGAVVRESSACDFIEKETLAQGFPVNFAKFYRITFFIEHLWWLLGCFCAIFHQFILKTVSAKSKAYVCSAFNENTLKTILINSKQLIY